MVTKKVKSRVGVPESMQGQMKPLSWKLSGRGLWEFIHEGGHCGQEEGK